jgi:hypothetical protein
MKICEPHRIDVDRILANLPDVGDGFAAAISTFARDPTPETAEALSIRAEGFSATMLLIRSALQEQEATK